MKKKMKPIAIAAVLLATGLFLVAGGATAALTPISPGPETSLIEAGGILDQLYGLGNLTRVDDSSDGVWFPANGNATATAKFADFSQEFGYIPQSNDGKFYDTDFTSLFIVPGSTNGINLPGPSATLGSGNVSFIWALNPSGAPLWTSFSSWNSDGLDHMVTWEIIDNPFTWVIAWEDLPGGGDRDFNDLVVEVSISPVPIPSALLLLGSGLVGLVGLRKRFKR